MNIFIIPSWYPSKREPLAGIFIKEQAEAIASILQQHNIFISRWGHSDGEMKLRSIQKSIDSLKWRFSAKERVIKLQDNLFEYFTPSVSFPFNSFISQAEFLLDTTLKNFSKIEREFGKIDLIHAHVSYPAGYIASKISEKRDTPYIITEHMSPFPFPPFIKNKELIDEIREAFNNSSAVIAVSRSLAERIESFGIKQVMTIPNLVDEDRFTISETVKERVIFKFLTVAAMTEQKGIDTLLKAIFLLKNRNDIEFIIAGDGAEKESYMKMSKELEISEKIKWLGAVSRVDIPKLFKECDAFVLASRHETFGIVYAEALASGKPVIGTKNGGAEFIINDDNGLLIDIDNPEQLADAIEKMVLKASDFNPHLIRADFEKRFSKRAVVAEIDKIYRRVAGGALCAA